MQPEQTEDARPGARDFALVLAVVEAPSDRVDPIHLRANAFVNWLTASHGGGVPHEHLHALITPQTDVRPISLHALLNELVPDLNGRNQDSPPVGRRCYLYLSGPAVDLKDDVRLAMRTAGTSRWLVLDASFQKYTAYLRSSGLFEEVVAIADVVMPSINVQSDQVPLFPFGRPAASASQCPTFSALRTTRISPEWVTDSATFATDDLGFTGAVVDALNGAAKDHNGVVSAASLMEYANARLAEETSNGLLPVYDVTSDMPPLVVPHPWPGAEKDAARERMISEVEQQFSEPPLGFFDLRQIYLTCVPPGASVISEDTLTDMIRKLGEMEPRTTEGIPLLIEFVLRIAHKRGSEDLAKWVEAWSRREGYVQQWVYLNQQLQEASARNSVRSQVATLTITLSPTPITLGGTSQGSAVAKDSHLNVLRNQPIEWFSTNDSVATVNSNGLVTAVAPGTTEIRASSGTQFGFKTLRVNDAGTDVPLIKIPHNPSIIRQYWMLSPDDSANILKINLSKIAKRATVGARLNAGDFVFLRGTSTTHIVGASQVVDAYRPVANASVPTAGPLQYDFALPLRFETPIEIPTEWFGTQQVAELDDKQNVTMAADGARAVAASCAAGNPSQAARLAEWFDTSVSGLMADFCFTLILRGSHADRERLFPLIFPLLEEQALADAVRLALSLEDSAKREAVLRSLVSSLLRSARAYEGLWSALRADKSASVRALVNGAGKSGDALPSELSFGASLVFATASRPITDWLKEASEVLNGWCIRRFCSYATGTDTETLVRCMNQSACIVLVWSKEVSQSSMWPQLLDEALRIERQRANEATALSYNAPQGEAAKTIVTLILDSAADLPASLASRRCIDATNVPDAPGEPTDRVVGQLVSAILESVELLDEAQRSSQPADSQRAQAPSDGSSLAIAPLDAVARITLESGDLLSTTVDVIVNAVGSDAIFSGEIGLQLTSRLGDQLLTDLKDHKAMATGETIVSETYGKIPAKNVIHVCMETAPNEHTTESVVTAVMSALRVAEKQLHLTSIAFPAVGSGSASLHPADVAPVILPAIVNYLSAGSQLTSVKFVFNNAETRSVYESAFAALRASLLDPPTAEATPAPTVAAIQWYISTKPPVAGTVLVGSNTVIELQFSRTASANSVPLLVPASAFELTVYVDATSAFYLGDNTPRAITVDRGNIKLSTLRLELTALSSGSHQARIAINARGGQSAGSEAIVTCTIDVEPPEVLANIPELVDGRTIPAPEPDVLLYVATEETAAGEQLRLHLTCASLRILRYKFDELLPLTRADVVAIRRGASEVADGVESSSPADARAALHAFGAMLYDLLVPAGHKLRSMMYNLLNVRGRTGYPPTWLVISDETASLPWEMLCVHGLNENGKPWYDEFLAARASLAHWIGRRGFDMTNEAPVGPLGVVHYGQEIESLPRWHDALGADLASETNRSLGLDVLKRGSPFFGVHLLRFSKPDEDGGIAVATEVAAPVNTSSSALVGERRLDFTSRRPIVTMSFVDAALDRGAQTANRYSNIEQAWIVPFLLARVSAVVGPRWTTSPASDRLFFRAFYDAVRSDRPLGHAVWEARQQLRLARPDRADWLAYTYFGHPECEPYPVETAEGFTLFEPIGNVPNEQFVAGETYDFRASFRGELPSWYTGRRRARTSRIRGEGVSVLVAPLSGDQPQKFDLLPASDATEDDDFYRIVKLTIPDDLEPFKVFVQFTRGQDVLRQTVITLDVTHDDPRVAAGMNTTNTVVDG
ncbi:MAG: macro domain-containing protein [Gemmatimonas sp.]